MQSVIYRLENLADAFAANKENEQENRVLLPARLSSAVPKLQIKIPLKYILLHRMLYQHSVDDFDHYKRIFEIDSNIKLHYNKFECAQCSIDIYNAHNLVANENCFVCTKVRSLVPRRCCCIMFNNSAYCGRCLLEIENYINPSEILTYMLNTDRFFLIEKCEM